MSSFMPQSTAYAAEFLSSPILKEANCLSMLFKTPVSGSALIAGNCKI